MKFNLCLIIWFFSLSFNVEGQLAIDSLSGFNFPLDDTTLCSHNSNWLCTTSDLSLDLNNDALIDITFSISCYEGGFGSSHAINVATFNEFKIHADTNYIEHYQYPATDGVHDTIRKRTVFKKYTWGDIIPIAQSPLSDSLPILNTSTGNFPSCIYMNVDLLNHDTAYLAVESADHALYYFKIAQQYSNYFTLFYVKSSVPFWDKIQLFPNPTSGVLQLDKSYKIVKIYNSFGSQVKIMYDVFDSIDVSELAQGLYSISLTDDKKVIQTKFIKL
jgi:hypothetical protein